MKQHHLARIAAASALALTLLSGCTTYRQVSSYLRSDKAEVCPDAVILANASVLSAFDPKQGADPSSVVYTATFTDIASSCDYRRSTASADTRVLITYKATRAPGGAEATYRVPYFVAVTNEGKIVDKHNYWLEVEFARGATEVNGKAIVDSLVVDIAKATKSYEYHLIAGFQLTQAQIDYNKKNGQYLP